MLGAFHRGEVGILSKIAFRRGAERFPLQPSQTTTPHNVPFWKTLGDMDNGAGQENDHVSGNNSGDNDNANANSNTHENSSKVDHNNNHDVINRNTRNYITNNKQKHDH